jgi:hypothetical protein
VAFVLQGAWRIANREGHEWAQKYKLGNCASWQGQRAPTILAVSRAIGDIEVQSLCVAFAELRPRIVLEPAKMWSLVQRVRFFPCFVLWAA